MALILIVDDDPQMLRLLTDVAELENHSVLMAQDGDQALEYFAHQLPDLMITDILMPNKEGLELISEVREKFSSVKIIAYSGGGASDPENYLEFARGMGADTVFTKPMPLEDMRQQINKLLSEKVNN